MVANKLHALKSINKLQMIFSFYRYLLTKIVIGITLLIANPVYAQVIVDSVNESNAKTLLPEKLINGGIALFKLDEEPESPPQWQGKSLLYFYHQSDQTWYAALGIPLDSDATISIISNGKTYSKSLQVIEYPKQFITIKNKRQVNPEQRDLTRIQSEYQQMRPIYQSYSQPLQHNSINMLRPVDGITSSPFGLKRFFNQQPRRPHSGLDIAAPEGTPIKSPSKGTVVLTGDFFFNGNSVFIDHGQGLISMMCHLYSIDVKQGQKLEAGDLIGTVGKTGRATGPHLHWTVSLNNNRIDPAILLEKR